MPPKGSARKRTTKDAQKPTEKGETSTSCTEIKQVAKYRAPHTKNLTTLADGTPVFGKGDKLANLSYANLDTNYQTLLSRYGDEIYVLCEIFETFPNTEYRLNVVHLNSKSVEKDVLVIADPHIPSMAVSDRFVYIVHYDCAEIQYFDKHTFEHISTIYVRQYLTQTVDSLVVLPNDSFLFVDNFGGTVRKIVLDVTKNYDFEVAWTVKFDFPMGVDYDENRRVIWVENEFKTLCLIDLDGNIVHKIASPVKMKDEADEQPRLIKIHEDKLFIVSEGMIYSYDISGVKIPEPSAHK